MSALRLFVWVLFYRFSRLFPARLRPYAAKAFLLGSSQETLAKTAHEVSLLNKEEDPDIFFNHVRKYVEDDPQTVSYALKTFRATLAWIECHTDGALHKRILELGPGYSLTQGALLVASGADHYTGVDLFPIAHMTPSFYARLRQELIEDRNLIRTRDHDRIKRTMLERLDQSFSVENDRVSPKDRFLSFQCPIDAHALPFPDESFDICLSNAAFEHFRDPAQAARETLRVLKKGGFGLHQIDFRDHRDFNKPLEFLRFSKEEWDGLFSKAHPQKDLGPRRDAFQYTNRLRKSAYVHAFEAAGAKILKVDNDLVFHDSGDTRASLHDDFRHLSRDDLGTLSALFVMKKPLE